MGVLNDVETKKAWVERSSLRDAPAGSCLQSCDFPAWKARTNVVRSLVTMAEKDLLPLTQNVARGLNDKLYEKRKTAALEIER